MFCVPMRCVMLKRVAPAFPFLVVMITTPFVAREPYMALAAADLSTSMLSMSFGLMSAMRLTVWS
jgi:hypothetical protein